MNDHIKQELICLIGKLKPASLIMPAKTEDTHAACGGVVHLK